MNGIKQVTQHLDLWFTLLSETNVFHQSYSRYQRIVQENGLLQRSSCFSHAIFISQTVM